MVETLRQLSRPGKIDHNQRREGGEPCSEAFGWEILPTQ